MPVRWHRVPVRAHATTTTVPAHAAARRCAARRRRRAAVRASSPVPTWRRLEWRAAIVRRIGRARAHPSSALLAQHARRAGMRRRPLLSRAKATTAIIIATTATNGAATATAAIITARAALAWLLLLSLIHI